MSNVECTIQYESWPVMFKSLFGTLKNGQDLPHNRNHSLLGLNGHYGLKFKEHNLGGKH